MSRASYTLAAAALALPALSGCVISVEEPAPKNYSPRIEYAESGCYWDSFNRDYIWYFEADVNDPDGPYDVVEVWADVFDARGDYLESFRLFRETQYADVWFSDWLQSYSYLDCAWRDYSVDLVAYDSLGQIDQITTLPYQSP